MQEKNMGHICPIGRSGVKIYNALVKFIARKLRQTAAPIQPREDPEDTECNFEKGHMIT